MDIVGTVGRLALIAGVGLSLTGCEQFAMLKARQSFKDANRLYQAQEYQRAATIYEETVADPRAFEAAPELTVAYFYLANSYDNLYRPSQRGEPENDAFLDKAIENYREAAERIEDPRMRRLSMEYLVAAYGPDKLNDPNRAEPIVRGMIELEPEEPTNYFALANIYENSGRYEEAEEILVDARGIRPDDPTVYLQLAGFYNRQGEFEKTIAALEERAAREPDNPEAYYTIATYFWEKAFRDFRLTEDEQKQYVMDGLDAVNKALDLKDDYMEAMVYKNILLRMQANTETDQARQDELIAEADLLRDQAEEMRRAQAAGVG